MKHPPFLEDEAVCVAFPEPPRVRLHPRRMRGPGLRRPGSSPLLDEKAELHSCGTAPGSNRLRWPRAPVLCDGHLQSRGQRVESKGKGPLRLRAHGRTRCRYSLPHTLNCERSELLVDLFGVDAEGGGDGDLLAVPEDEDLDYLARLVGAHLGHQVGEAVDGHTIEPDDHVIHL